MSNKITIYQVLPRLLTNTQNKNVENGTIQENGCGKINDITLSFLKRIKSNGFPIFGIQVLLNMQHRLIIANTEYAQTHIVLSKEKQDHLTQLKITMT